ncbi:hypothetical protein P9112_009351 [Eukaryota sp. TZLM1-RC]
MLGGQYEELIDSLSCQTCSELMVVPTTLFCGHSHCRGCITRYMQQRSSCQCCRESISSSRLSVNIALRDMIELLRTSSSRKTCEEANPVAIQDALPKDIFQLGRSLWCDDKMLSGSDSPTATTGQYERISALESRIQELHHKLSKVLFDRRQDARRIAAFLKKERTLRMHLQGNYNSHQQLYSETRKSAAYTELKETAPLSFVSLFTGKRQYVVHYPNRS